MKRNLFLIINSFIVYFLIIFFIFGCAEENNIIKLEVFENPIFEVNKFVPEKIKIRAYYSEEKYKTITINNKMYDATVVSEFQKVGKHKFEVIYNDYSLNIIINVVSKNENFVVKIVNNDVLVLNQNHNLPCFIEEPTIPAREGYDFIGWFESDKPFSFDQEIKENLYIIAKYDQKKCKVTFMVDDEFFNEMEVFYGEVLRNIKSPEKDGYIFMCWSIEFGNLPIKEDYIVTAVFK